MGDKNHFDIGDKDEPFPVSSVLFSGAGPGRLGLSVLPVCFKRQGEDGWWDSVFNRVIRFVRHYDNSKNGLAYIAGHSLRVWNSLGNLFGSKI